MKNSKKEIATKRMEILFNNALSNAKNNPGLAQRQAEIAKKLALNLKSKCHLKSVQVFVKNAKNSLLLGSHQKYALVLNQSP